MIVVDVKGVKNIPPVVQTISGGAAPHNRLRLGARLTGVSNSAGKAKRRAEDQHKNDSPSRPAGP